MSRAASLSIRFVPSAGTASWRTNRQYSLIVRLASSHYPVDMAGLPVTASSREGPG
jgi:hypothetical protein